VTKPFVPNNIDPRPHELEVSDEVVYRPSAPLKGPVGSDWGIGGVGADANSTIDKIPPRFMRGLLNDEKNARARWQQTKKWREKEGIDFLLDEPNPGYYQFKKHYKHYYHKRSKTGEFLYVEKCGQGKVENLWKMGFTMQQLARHYVWTSEYMWRVKDRDDDKMLISLFDLKGCTLNQLKGTQLSLFKECSMLIGSHYPERSKMTFVINAPWWISAAFTIIRPFMDPRTFEKIKVLGSDYKKHLFEYFDPSVIPIELGGTDEDALGEAPIEYEMNKHVKQANDRWSNMPLDEDDPVERDGYKSLLHPFKVPEAWLLAREDDSTPNLRDVCEDNDYRTVASSCDVLDAKAVDQDVVTHLNQGPNLLKSGSSCSQVGGTTRLNNDANTIENSGRSLSSLDVVALESGGGSLGQTISDRSSDKKVFGRSSSDKGSKKSAEEVNVEEVPPRQDSPYKKKSTLNRTDFTTANAEPKSR